MKKIQDPHICCLQETHITFKDVCACSVTSDSLQPHGLQPTGLLYSWDFPRQEYFRGWPFPTPGDIPNPGTKPTYLVCPALAGGFFTTREASKSPSVQFSCSVVSDSLRPHEPQHARPPCPSPTPGVHSNSCLSSQ